MKTKTRISIIIFLLVFIALFAISCVVNKSSAECNIEYAHLDITSGLHDVVSTGIHETIQTSISYGSDDEERVKMIQERLKELGYYTYDVDMVFGKYTKYAVMDFQSANEIVKDGVVGNQTWTRLLSEAPITYDESELGGHYLDEIKVSYSASSGSTQASSSCSSGVYAWGSYLGDYVSASSLRYHGNLVFNGMHWTFYSQRVLPGGGLNIPGRHVDGDGFVCDENGYICLATPSGANGSVYMTPFGRYGKSYDYCPEGNMDVYVDW